MEGVSLFTGIGGFDLAAEQAGIKIVTQVENDRFCNRVLKRRFPGMPWSMEDIRNVRGDEFGSPDVVCFGSPCQDLSVAGKRAGFEGERSSLFFEAVRIIEQCRPAFAVWENVYGAFSSHRGRDFAQVLMALRELGRPDIAWRTIDSQYAGVPQRRRRIFLVADFRGERAREILFESEGCGGHFAPGRATWEAIAGSVGGGAYGSGRRTIDDPNLVCVARPLRAQGNSPHREDSMTYAPEVAYALADSTGTRTGSGRDAQDTFIAHPRNITSKGNRSRVRAGDPSPSLHSEPVSIIEPGRMRVRRLTPLECERLQGFPDGWTCLCPAGGDSMRCTCPDGPRYRALGNAVTMIVARWIFERMVALR